VGESWIVSNLNAALSTWNDKLGEIWSLLTESPQTFKGGQVWGVMTGIHGALQAIGYGLLVLFFAVAAALWKSKSPNTRSSCSSALHWQRAR
jgi:hypothetical protein